MRYAIHLLLATMLLTACAQEPGNFTVQMLPDVQEFSKEEQDEGANELEKYGSKMPVVMTKLLPACKQMRDQTRAIRRELGQN